MKNCLYEAVLEKIASNCSCAPTFVNFKLSVSECRGLTASQSLGN